MPELIDLSSLSHQPFSHSVLNYRRSFASHFWFCIIQTTGSDIPDGFTWIHNARKLQENEGCNSTDRLLKLFVHIHLCMCCALFAYTTLCLVRMIYTHRNNLSTDSNGLVSGEWQKLSVCTHTHTQEHTIANRVILLSTGFPGVAD